MAKNKVYNLGDKLSLVCTSPAAPVSGDPVLVGRIPGVAQTNERADGTTSVDMDGVYTLSVTAVGAIAVGDRLYAVAGSPVVINNTNTGVPFGFALGAIGAGLTAAINVKLQGSTS